jgi:hypothetical protein
MPIPSLDHLRRGVVALGLLASGLATTAASLAAQMPAMIEVDPNTPVKEGFDTDRALLFEESNFVPLRDPAWQSLRSVLRAGDVADDTRLLVFEVGGEKLALVSAQMSYHHVAQGEMNGEPWMVTF